MIVVAGEGPLAGGFVLHVPGCGTMWHGGTLGEAYDEARRWYRSKYPKRVAQAVVPDTRPIAEHTCPGCGCAGFDAACQRCGFARG